MIYVISDLHAHSKTFEKFKEMLTPEDKVICLGDAVDKGDGTLDVLRDIMHDMRFEFILGNHEYMLYEYLYLSKLESKLDELSEDDYKKLRHEHEGNLKYDWLILSHLASKAYDTYMWNDGRRTLDDYLELTHETQEEIYDFLKTSLVQLEFEYKGRKFVFAHAAPNESSKMSMGVLTMNRFDLFNYDDKIELESFVWDRTYYKPYKDRIVVTGHNPVPYIFNDSLGNPSHLKYFPETDSKYSLKPDKNGWHHPVTVGRWYDIDGALAFREKGFSNLYILRLDDMCIKIIPDEDDEYE